MHCVLTYFALLLTDDWRNIFTISAVGLSGYEPTSKKNWKVLHHCLKLSETLVEVIQRPKSDINKDTSSSLCTTTWKETFLTQQLGT